MKREAGKNGFLAGSYTVEAAFLVPIILGIFFAWLFQLFYLHDKVVMNGMLEEVVVQQEETEIISLDDNDDIGSNERDRIQSHLWLMTITSLQKKKGITGEKYILKSEATWNIPIMSRFIPNHFADQISYKIGNVHPETFLRTSTGGE